jgi:hypothetical protein
MKRALALWGLPVLLLVMAAPVQAAASLPYTTNLVIESRNNTRDVGDLTVSAEGTVTFQIDELSTDLRLSYTQLYVGDTPPKGPNSNRYQYLYDRLDGAVSNVYDVDLVAADINGDGIVYIAAQAGLSATPILNNPKSKGPMKTTETAWARGDQTSGKGGNSVQYFSVQVGWGTAGPPG